MGDNGIPTSLGVIIGAAVLGAIILAGLVVAAILAL